MCNGDCKCEGKCGGKCGREGCECAIEEYKEVHEETRGYTHPADADGVDHGPLAPEIETEDGTVDNPNDGEQFPDN